jgi:hypothetical protein
VVPLLSSDANLVPWDPQDIVVSAVLWVLQVIKEVLVHVENQDQRVAKDHVVPKVLKVPGVFLEMMDPEVPQVP